MIIRRAGRDRPVDMLEAVGLAPPARFEDTDAPEVRIFGRDAAEILPHAANDVRDLAFRQTWKSALDIVVRTLGDAEKRTDQAAQGAANSGCAIERQYCEGGEQQPGSPSLQTMDEPRRPSPEIGPTRFDCHRSRG